MWWSVLILWPQDNQHMDRETSKTTFYSLWIYCGSEDISWDGGRTELRSHCEKNVATGVPHHLPMGFQWLDLRMRSRCICVRSDLNLTHGHCDQISQDGCYYHISPGSKTPKPESQAKSPTLLLEQPIWQQQWFELCCCYSCIPDKNIWYKSK